MSWGLMVTRHELLVILKQVRYVYIVYGGSTLRTQLEHIHIHVCRHISSLLQCLGLFTCMVMMAEYKVVCLAFCNYHTTSYDILLCQAILNEYYEILSPLI